VVLRNRGANRDVVVLQSGQGLTAYDPATGESVWEFHQGCAIIASAAVAGDRLFVPSNGLTALKTPADGNPPEVLWRANRSESTPSPLYYRSQVFTVNGAGVLESADATSGTLLWRLRLSGPFSASPVAAGGHLYLFNEQGESAVVKPGLKQGEIVGTGQLGETILCTPAIAHGAIYVRSDRHLWKLAKP
jgi:outer membrane protein assembly factor BamB